MRFITVAPSRGWVATPRRAWHPDAAAALRTAFICATALMGALRADAGTITTAPATVATPDNVENVQGLCTNYQSTLAATGVTQPNGVTHPGFCRYSDYEPLFDGKTLAQYMASVTQGTSRPYRLTVWPILPWLGVCVTTIDLTLMLSAQVQISRLSWQNSQPTPGPMCTQEWNRVDPASMVAASSLLPPANSLVDTAAGFLRLELTRPNITACAANQTQSAATAALDAKVKAALQTIGDMERQAWMQSEPNF